MQFPSYIFLDKFMFLMTFLECTWKKTGQIWTDTLNFLFCYEIYFQKREKHNQEQVYITIITINNKYLHNYQSFSFYLNCPIFAPTVQICPCPDLPLGTVTGSNYHSNIIVVTRIATSESYWIHMFPVIGIYLRKYSFIIDKGTYF